MGITAKKAVRIEDQELNKLFDKKRAMWKGLAKEAYKYVAPTIEARGEKVRSDDLIAPLMPVLEISSDLRDFLAERRLTQNFWYEWFGEWIIDRVWSELP
jgi:hypothetical protein